MMMMIRLGGVADESARWDKRIGWWWGGRAAAAATAPVAADVFPLDEMTPIVLSGGSGWVM